MATRVDRTASKQPDSAAPATIRKRAPRKRATSNADADADADAAVPGRFGTDALRAGLKAVNQRNPLFDALMNFKAAQKRKQKGVFKIPTFEDLYDERVARALANLGVAQALDEINAKLADLDNRLRRIERPPAPRARRTKA